MCKPRATKRFIAALLAVILLTGFAAPQTGKAHAGEKLHFTKADFTPDYTLPESILDSDVLETQAQAYADDESVRVSIIMEDASTLAAGYEAYAAASDPAAIAYRNQLKIKQETVIDRIEADILDGNELDVVWNLTLAANIISANVEYGRIDEIEALDGVKEVYIETFVTPDVMESEGTAAPDMLGASQMTGASLAHTAGYTGAGSRIAVIDTGIDDKHQSFNAAAYAYSLQRRQENGDIRLDELDFMTADTIKDVYDQLNIAGDDVPAEQLFLSDKIAYAYNYADATFQIDHTDGQSGHGSHVAGIAAANAYIPSDTAADGFQDALQAVGVCGVAPDAQLLVMKVFGADGSAAESDYMAAVEDAIVLGADAINMSFGSQIPGSGRYTSAYADIFEMLLESGTVSVSSAGNRKAWAEHSKLGYLYADDVNMHTGGEPGSFYTALTVASVENADTSNFSSDGGYYTISDFSSYGVPGSLLLKPDLSAPGGNIFSVDGTKPDGNAYESLSGTSMAAPQVSGMLGVLGQYIDAIKLTEKGDSQRFLTQSLLMSTAEPMLEEASGQYYSVLRQGAGLANISKALSAQSYIRMHADATPYYADGKVKVELGDDPERSGTYTYTFTLNNFSGRENAYTLSTELFTQGLLTKRLSNGKNAEFLDTKLVPISANLQYTVDGTPLSPDAQFTVPADGAVTVRVEMQLKADLSAYPNGTYIEGYTFVKGIADANGVKDVEHSIPILGFYGNWSDPSMYDKGSYPASLYGDTSVPYVGAYTSNGVKGTNYLYYTDAQDGSTRIMIGNPYAIVPQLGYDTDRAAIRSTDQLVGFSTSMIRPAAAGAAVITDENDRVLMLGRVQNGIYAAYANGNTSNSLQIAEKSYTVDSTPANLGLKEGDIIKYKAVSVTEYYETDGRIDSEAFRALLESGRLGQGAYLSATLHIDDTKPEILEIVREENGNLTVTATDNQYLAYMCVAGKGGAYVYASHVPMAQEGDTVTYTFDLQNADIGPTCTVFVGDYARNSDTVIVDYGGEYPETDGKLVGYIHNAGESRFTRAWAAIDPDDVYHASVSATAYGMQIAAYNALDAVTAAAYVNGYLFHCIGTKLYASPAKEIDALTQIADLKTFGMYETVTALSYNRKDHLLYALTGSNALWRIDPRNGSAQEIAEITVQNRTGTSANVVTMAIDDTGRFYGTTYYNPGSPNALLTWTLQDITKGYLTLTASNLASNAVTDRYGSMAWDAEKGILYLAESYYADKPYNGNDLLAIDPETLTAVPANTAHGRGATLCCGIKGLSFIPTTDDDGVLAPCETLTNIDILPETLEMFVTGIEDLTPICTPWHAKEQNLSWSTTDSSVITVENGVITAVGLGTATVTATVEANPDISDSCTVTVVKTPDIDMSALLYEGQEASYWVNYNAANPRAWQAVQEGPSTYLYAGGLSNGLLYAHSGSYISVTDPDTYETTLIGTVTSVYTWSDATQATICTTTFNDLLAIANGGTRIEWLEASTGKCVYVSLDLGVPMATIAYAGTHYEDAYEKDCYYLLLEDGTLYSLKYYLLEERLTMEATLLGFLPRIDLTGVSGAGTGACASMEYDKQTGFLVLTSRMRGKTAQLQIIDPVAVRVRTNTDFGENIGPVVCQYLYEKTDTRIGKAAPVPLPYNRDTQSVPATVTVNGVTKQTDLPIGMLFE